MKPVTLSLRRPEYGDNEATAAATISAADHTFEITYRCSAGPLLGTADPFVPLALAPAMKIGAGLRIDAPVSAALLRNLDRLQDIYSAWSTDWTRTSIRCDRETSPHLDEERGRACLFTGSVETLHTATLRSAEITHLIIAGGLAGPTGSETMAVLQEASAALGKPAIVVNAGAYRFLRRFADWDRQSEGAALASVALLLAPQFSHVYVSLAVPYYRQLPAGLHPLTSRLWGGDLVRLIHAGGDLTPWQKAHEILPHPAARRCLRPCRQYQPGVYNCGVCADCIMMMAFLHAFGLQHTVASLPPLGDLAAIQRMPLLHRTQRAAADELILFIEEHGGSAEVASALKTCLRRYPSPDFDMTDAFRVRRAEARLLALTDELNSARSSVAWRATAPLRAVGRRFKMG